MGGRALATVLAVALPTRAAEPTESEPIRLEYTAPAGCPGASDFQRRVFERTSKVREAGEGESARTFVVVIEPSGAETQGSLVVREEGISTVARRVSGKDCDEVARALSLFTALAIDPEAKVDTPESRGTGEANGTGGAGTAANEPETPHENPTQKSDTPPKTRVMPAYPNDRRFSLLVGASAAFGPSPNPSFGASAAFEWNRERPLVFPSALGLELVFQTSAKNEVDGAHSGFSFAFARPYLCPARVAVGHELGVAPCVGAELGAVVANGSDIANPETETRFWAAGELALRFDFELSDEWYLDATAGVVFPFSRYRFLFRTPDTSIYEVPAVTAAAGLRIGRRL
ncbi:MAG TPA: hypothetical protein VF103_00430 [Polyangiaceae bacterium]